MSCMKHRVSATRVHKHKWVFTLLILCFLLFTRILFFFDYFFFPLLSKTLLNLYSYSSLSFASLICLLLLSHSAWTPRAWNHRERGTQGTILFLVCLVLNYICLCLFLHPHSMLLLKLLDSNCMAHFPFISSPCLINLTLYLLPLDVEITSQLTTFWFSPPSPNCFR